MTTVRYLTVNEMEGQSDRIGIEVQQCDASTGYASKDVRIAIKSNGELIMSQGNFSLSTKVSPNELLTFITEAKKFIEEEQIIAKLSGKNL